VISAIEKLKTPRIEPLGEIPANFADDYGAWIVKRAADFLGNDGIRFALIHADDGVLWGIVDSGHLGIPTVGHGQQDDRIPRLRSGTIQQCRIFGKTGELFIWRESEEKLRGRIVIDEAGASYEKIHEPQVLWGRRVHDLSRSLSEGFTLIYEPTTGIRQPVPCQITQPELDDGYRVVLQVAHYLVADDDGQARMFCSRLEDVGLKKL
jgi:CRISPR-associated protein (TIGR03984 family)